MRVGYLHSVIFELKAFGSQAFKITDSVQVELRVICSHLPTTRGLGRMRGAERDGGLLEQLGNMVPLICALDRTAVWTNCVQHV